MLFFSLVLGTVGDSKIASACEVPPLIGHILQKRTFFLLVRNGGQSQMCDSEVAGDDGRHGGFFFLGFTIARRCPSHRGSGSSCVYDCFCESSDTN